LPAQCSKDTNHSCGHTQRPRAAVFEAQEIVLSRVLTDWGIGILRSASHEYEFYVAVEDIEDMRTKTKGICERFDKTVFNEFYLVTFREKIHGTPDELQVELTTRLKLYNEERPHQGRWCYGKTAM
jgi:hypothetical protein